MLISFSTVDTTLNGILWPGCCALIVFNILVEAKEGNVMEFVATMASARGMA